MKKLQRYYYYVGIPIAIVTIGTIAFFNAIMGTVHGNPHPQINILIFIIIPAGMIMMWMHVHRMNREHKLIEEFYKQAQHVESPEAAHQLAVKIERSDSAAVLQLVKEVLGKAVSSVQHSALEAELDRFSSTQARRLNLPNFLGGLMVGLGLLGTFIGLLGALSEIGKLIGSFSNVSTGDPSAAIRSLVENLTAPMQAMGVAFSASLFGVLGSLIMGVLLVGVKNCSAELSSNLRSRVALLVDFGTGASTGKNMTALSQALAKIAEQSPVLSGLLEELSHSETRANDLMLSMTQLVSKVELQDARMQVLVKYMDTAHDADSAVKQSIATLVRTLPAISEGLDNHFRNSQILYSSVDSLRDTMREYVDTLHDNVTRTEQQQAQREKLQQAMLDNVQMEMKAMLDSQNAHYKDADESRKTQSKDTQNLLATLQNNHFERANKNTQWQSAIGMQLVEAMAGISKHMQLQSETMTTSNNRLELALMRQAKI